LSSDILSTSKNIKIACPNNFVQVKSNNFSGLVKFDLIFATNPEKIKEFFWAKDVVICKDRPKIRAILYQDYFIKSYNFTGLFNVLRRVFKTSRPMKVLKAFLQLEKHNVPTPKVFAAISERKVLFPVVDYLVTQKVDANAKFADSLLRDYKSKDNFNLANSHKWILSSVLLIVKMHQAKVLHGDLNLRNLYYTGTIEELNGSWGVIDLDGAKVYRSKLSTSLITKDLACLVVGFLKVIRSSNIDWQFAENIVVEYEKLTGVTIDRKLYNKRIIYLFKRFQRFLKKYYKMNNK
jgi:hypothetical protein